MNIPGEAVEAAAKRIGDAVTYRDIRTILEAAAPYLMAQAFDEGQKSGMRHADRLVAAAKIGHPELPGPISPNPYRSEDG